MGEVYADIELINGEDVSLARRYFIGEDEIRHLHLNILVDSGCYMLAINETIQEQLQLAFVEKRKLKPANNRVVEYDVVGPVNVKFANRKATCNAFLLPGDSKPLLGAIPLEEMDVLIHPLRQELIVNPEHPEGVVLRGQFYAFVQEYEAFISPE